MARFIKLYDSLLDWQHFKQPNYLQVFVALLFRANWKDGYDRQGNEILAGQAIISQREFCEDCGISRNTLIKTLDGLQESGEISIKTDRNYSLITINNYSKYQSQNEEGGSFGGSNFEPKVEPHIEPRVEPIQEIKEIIEYNNINNIGQNEILPQKQKQQNKQIKKSKDERKKEFAERLAEYKDQYTHEMLLAFYEYWTESNEGENTKMRFEKEKTYELSKRLKTWFNRQNGKQYGTDGKGQTKNGRFETGINPVSEYERDF